MACWLGGRFPSISSLSLHRDRDRQPTAYTSEASHEPKNGDRRISPGCIDPESPYEPSIRQHAADGPTRRTHTHTRDAIAACSVLDVALCPSGSSLRRLPLRKSALREHAPLTILELPLLLAALLVALRVDDPLVF